MSTVKELSEEIVGVLKLLGVEDDDVITLGGGDEVTLKEFVETNVTQEEGEEDKNVDIKVIKETLETIKRKIKENVLEIIKNEFYETYYA